MYGYTRKAAILNTPGVCGATDYSSRLGIYGSHHRLEVDLDDLIPSMDLSGQVCRRLGGQTNKAIANPHPKFSQTQKQQTQAAWLACLANCFSH